MLAISWKTEATDGTPLAQQRLLAGQRGHVARDRRAGDASACARIRDAISEGCGGEQGAESQETELRADGLGRTGKSARARPERRCPR